VASVATEFKDGAEMVIVAESVSVLHHCAKSRRTLTENVYPKGGPASLLVVASTDRAARRSADLDIIVQEAAKRGMGMAVVDLNGDASRPLLSDGNGSWEAVDGNAAHNLASARHLLDDVHVHLARQHGVYAAQHHMMERVLYRDMPEWKADAFRAHLGVRKLVCFSRTSEDEPGVSMMGAMGAGIIPGGASMAISTTQTSSGGRQIASIKKATGVSEFQPLHFSGTSVYRCIENDANGDEEIITAALKAHPLVKALVSGRVPPGSVVMPTAVDKLSRTHGLLRRLVQFALQHDVELMLCLADGEPLERLKYSRAASYTAAALEL
jgi:hypothetical protein